MLPRTQGGYRKETAEGRITRHRYVQATEICVILRPTKKLRVKLLYCADVHCRIDILAPRPRSWVIDLSGKSKELVEELRDGPGSGNVKTSLVMVSYISSIPCDTITVDIMDVLQSVSVTRLWP